MRWLDIYLHTCTFSEAEPTANSVLSVDSGGNDYRSAGAPAWVQQSGPLQTSVKTLQSSGIIPKDLFAWDRSHRTGASILPLFKQMDWSRSSVCFCQMGSVHARRTCIVETSLGKLTASPNLGFCCSSKTSANHARQQEVSLGAKASTSHSSNSSGNIYRNA
jgi:hypothetical protein